MSAWARSALAAAMMTGLVAGAAVAAGQYGLGEPATPEQIAGWDIDVRPDGKGLPPGRGTAEQGESVYYAKCAACHGEFGEARGNYPVLMGGFDTLTRDRPVKTVGSYWPYATTVFDYVRRAMPFGHAQSLSDDETYAITAFLLNLNEIVDYDEVVDQDSLPGIVMPNHDGFIADDRPDTPLGEPCMSDCRGEFEIIGRARTIDVTPEDGMDMEGGGGTAVAAADAAFARGKTVFQQCAACHSLAAGEHRVGPSLHGIVGRAAASADGFDRYSAAMKDAGLTWTEDNLASFLAAPQEVVAGNAMPFPGIADEQEIRDLLEYLKRQGS